MKEKTKQVLYYFILLQPFLDLYWFYNGKLAEVLPFTLPTIIRILAVFAIFCMFFSQKQNWQKLGRDKWLIAYLVLLVIYSILHLWHVRNFTSVNPSNYGYSAGSEIFYLIRMALPLATMYFTKESDFSAQDLANVIKWISGLFSGTIVISNLFVISLRSYGEGRISANIFQWFVNSQIGYSHMASKGFFNFSNMVSAVLFMLVPFMVYYLFSEFNWKNTVLLIMQALAMIELGTKVAAFGLIGGIVIAILIHAAHAFLFKNAKKNSKALITALVIAMAAVGILPFRPTIQRYNYEKQLALQSDHDLSKEKQELAAGLKKYPKGEKREEFLRDFIEKNYEAYALNKRFVFKSYPYKYDPEFWLRIMREPGDLRMQNRHLELAMLNQVVKTNNNKLDKVFGISYTRESNIFNLERDFMSQVYSLGWIGMILFIGPYVGILLYGVFKWLTNKRVRTYLISTFLAATVFMLAAAYSSGNVMDFLTASLILAFTEGNLLIQIKKQL